MNNRTTKNKGFSLIELLVAVTLLSIVMIMVSQFMSTTSGAYTKTQRNLNIQTEALEFGEQVSDILAQASYIRMEADGKQYVSDRYPEYLDVTNKERSVIYNKATGGLQYEIKGANGAITYGDYQDVVSFRSLKGDNLKFTYVTPSYLYVRYTKKVADAETNDVNAPDSYEAYAMFKFDGKAVYVYKGDISSLGGLTNTDGYSTAKGLIDASLNSNPKAGLLTENVKSSRFTADTEGNSVYLNVEFEDDRYKGYTYNYEETVTMRNTNVLSVEPNRMFTK